MHTAAVHMVRHLTAGMAMITCREPLLLSISNNLKSAFNSVLRVRDLNEVCHSSCIYSFMCCCVICDLKHWNN